MSIREESGMRLDRYGHPLVYVRAVRHWSQGDLARLIRRAASRRGLRTSTDRNRIWKWESGRVEPDEFSQELLAEVLDVPLEHVTSAGWPWWLPVHGHDAPPPWSDHDHSLAIWSSAATVKSLVSVTEGPVMDRRSFLIASTGTVTAAAMEWAGHDPLPGTPSTTGRRVSAHTADLLDGRLEGLRRLDDRLGSAEVHQAARAELRLITTTLREASYTDAVGSRLYAAAAEAGRICGWTAYDSSQPAAAERFYLASLRASGHTTDRAVGATILAGWAGLRYSRNDPQGALGILDQIIGPAHRTGSARVTALLHARKARAHAKTGDRRHAYQAIDAAFDAYTQAGPVDQDIGSMYWLTQGELHQFAASTALDLGDHRRALEQFQAAERADDPYDAELDPRGTAIYLARQAESHLALGEFDAAVHLARQADILTDLAGSARGSGTLAALRDKIAAHRAIPEVREYLAA